MNAEPTRTTDWYLDHLAADTERFAALLETASTDVPIAACPGWDVLRLAEHVGQIHRWAEFCATNGRPPTADDPPLEAFEPERAAGWLRDGAAGLAATLRGLDPAGPTWHPFPTDQVGAVWPRRQAHETAVHRWDAERAVGLDAEFDADLASDGIDEYFELAIPRLITGRGITVPAGSLHVHCTDVDGEWLVWSEAGDYHMIRAHQKGDAALRGPAAPILLRLWGRESGRDDELSPVGDESVLADWLAIAGM
ncbi:MAG: maleylpyruvate isomerase family mycothiol-dependent enzyme [Ilumatobacteraceae bacterium]|nr:maleylpyruvate isomerase family mycothiol-dependent enzyme [Ilumatobacteraceae bacterium]